MKGDVVLSEADRGQVKQVARDLLDKLKGAKLVLDWRNRQKTRADVKVTLEQFLDQLPAVYNQEMFKEKSATIYDHFFDKYQGEGVSIYQPDSRQNPKTSKSTRELLVLGSGLPTGRLTGCFFTGFIPIHR